MKEILQKIRLNNLAIRRGTVKKILIVINVEGYAIGDSVLFFSRMRAISRYFNNLQFDVLTNKQHHVFLHHSPLVEQFFFDFAEVNFTVYDLIINFSKRDTALAEFLSEKYYQEIMNSEVRFGVYSLYMQKGTRNTDLFEYFLDFENYLFGDYHTEREFSGHELHLSDEEIKWGNDWFREQGVQHTDRVVILLDSASARNKLMPLNEYFEVVRFFTSLKNVRVLIFDPDNINKRLFYEHMLGEEMMSKFIFVKRHGLRKDFCLLASDYVHMVLGPCTGLLHCAEGIYNTQHHKRKLKREWPLLVSYMGPSDADDLDKWFWWGCTHVECLFMLKDAGASHAGKIKKLSGPDEYGLPPGEFLAAPLIRYMQDNYGQKFREWNML